MADPDENEFPVLIKLSKRQQTMIGLLFQRCNWDYKPEVLTKREYKQLRPNAVYSVKSSSKGIATDENPLNTTNESDKATNDEKTAISEKAANDVITSVLMNCEDGNDLTIHDMNKAERQTERVLNIDRKSEDTVENQVEFTRKDVGHSDSDESTIDENETNCEADDDDFENNEDFVKESESLEAKTLSKDKNDSTSTENMDESFAETAGESDEEAVFNKYLVIKTEVNEPEPDIESSTMNQRAESDNENMNERESNFVGYGKEEEHVEFAKSQKNVDVDETITNVRGYGDEQVELDENVAIKTVMDQCLEDYPSEKGDAHNDDDMKQSAKDVGDFNEDSSATDTASETGNVADLPDDTQKDSGPRLKRKKTTTVRFSSTVAVQKADNGPRMYRKDKRFTSLNDMAYMGKIKLDRRGKKTKTKSKQKNETMVQLGGTENKTKRQKVETIIHANYYDPIIEQLIDHLRDSKIPRPYVSSLLLRCCCMFLLEKDLGFSEWSKHSIKSTLKSQKVSDWKSLILDIAFQSKQLLLDVIIQRFQEFIDANTNPKFLEYLTKFLFAAQALTMWKGKTGEKVKYNDVIVNLKKNAIIEEHASFPNDGEEEDKWEEHTGPLLPPEESDYKKDKRKKEKKVEEVDDSNVAYEKKRIPCEYCNLKFQRNKMRLHVNKAHPEHGIAHQCYTCKKVFRYGPQLVQHGKETKHKVSFPVECPICHITLRNDTCLANHVRHRHNQDVLLHCDICKKQSNGQSTKCLHIENYTPRESHPCDICGKIFKSKKYMETHRIGHTESTNRFKCEFCGKGFLRKKFLRLHKRIHTGEKPHKCPYCDYRSAFASNLPKHIRTHEKNLKTGKTETNNSYQNSRVPVDDRTVNMSVPVNMSIDQTGGQYWF